MATVSGTIDTWYHIMGHRPVTRRVSRPIVLVGKQARGKKYGMSTWSVVESGVRDLFHPG